MNKLLGTTLVSVCLAAASSAFAQGNPNSDSVSPPRPAHRLADRPFARPTERVEARLAYMKTALKIAEAQQPQWDAYANVVRKNARDLEQRFQAIRSGEKGWARQQRPNAIERLERAQSSHAELVTRINQLLEVEKPLYAALSPEQRKVADVVLNRPVRFFGRPFMHGRGGFERG